MAPPVAVYVVAAVATAGAVYLFKEYVYEPHIAPKVERWAEGFLARRQESRRQRERARNGPVAVPQHQDDSDDATSSGNNGHDNGDSSAVELHDLASFHEMSENGDASRAQAYVRRRQSRHPRLLDESDPHIAYDPLSPEQRIVTHVIYDADAGSSLSSSPAIPQMNLHDPQSPFNIHDALSPRPAPIEMAAGSPPMPATGSRPMSLASPFRNLATLVSNRGTNPAAPSSNGGSTRSGRQSASLTSNFTAPARSPAPVTTANLHQHDISSPSSASSLSLSPSAESAIFSYPGSPFSDAAALPAQAPSPSLGYASAQPPVSVSHQFTLPSAQARALAQSQAQVHEQNPWNTPSLSQIQSRGHSATGSMMSASGHTQYASAQSQVHSPSHFQSPSRFEAQPRFEARSPMFNVMSDDEFEAMSDEESWASASVAGRR